MYQKIIIIGNLGSDPEMRYMPDGTAVTNFSIATNRRWTGADGKPAEETTWFRVSVWGRQAETVNQYLSRGRRALIEGVLTPDRATGGPRTFTRRDGTVGASFEIRADTVRFLGGRDDVDTSAGSMSYDGPAESNNAIEEDDIPF